GLHGYGARGARLSDQGRGRARDRSAGTADARWSACRVQTRGLLAVHGYAARQARTRAAMAVGLSAVEAMVTEVRAEAAPANRPSCRSCGHADLIQVLSLGHVPLANALLTAEELRGKEERFPLELYFCPQCALAQIGETVPPQRLFRDYTYASSFSDTMVEHARTLVETLIGRHELDNGSLVVEVASNDGYLLQFYKARGIPVLGIEPAANIAELAIKTKGIPTLVEFFGEHLARRLAARGQFADIIHAHNVF